MHLSPAVHSLVIAAILILFTAGMIGLVFCCGDDPRNDDDDGLQPA